MKFQIAFFIFILFPLLNFSQNQESTSTFAPLIPTNKITLLKDVDVIFNTRMELDNFFKDGNHTISKFGAGQYRFEIKGKVHEKVYFRFRNRYTKTTETNTIDNMNRSVDLAHVIVDLSPNSKLTVGKMIGDWGGYELLMNPIEVLSFNTINSNCELFLVGAAYTYAVPSIKSKFNFQLLNNRTKTFQDQYTSTIPAAITESKVPLVSAANWKGCFFDGKFETSYSYTFASDAENSYRNLVTLGNKYKNKNFVMYYDFQYSNEDLDQKAVVSNIIKKQNPTVAEDVTYIENWIRAEYKIRPKINILLTLMNHNSYWSGNPDPNNNAKMMTSYGIINSIEYYPFKDFNFKFFLGYIGKKYNYSSYAESQFNAVDYTTSQVSIGIISPLLVL